MTKYVYLVLDDQNDYITTCVTRQEARDYRKAKKITQESRIRRVDVTATPVVS